MATTNRGAIIGASYTSLSTTSVSTSYGPVFSTPTPVSLTGWVSGVAPTAGLTQTGSRIYYINPSHTTGNPSGKDNPATLADCQANIMYWNGTNLVDAAGFTSPGGVGTLYGTDPWNPSGTVNEFTTWSSVAPRNSTAIDIGGTTGSPLAPGNIAPSAMMRAGFADFWFIKRGETLDLTADLAAWNATRGISALLHGLNIPTGTSTTARHVLGCYGPTTTARPTVIKPTTTTNTFFNTNVAGLNHVLVTGLKVDGLNRTASTAPQYMSYLAQAAGDTDVTFEDMWFLRGKVGLTVGNGGSQETPPDSSFAGGITFRGCIISDTFSWAAGTSGIFFGGKRGSSMRMISCIFMRSGLSRDPTARTKFVPDGSEVVTGDTVVSLVGNGAAVVATTSNANGTTHGVQVGDSVTVSGANEAGFNGTFTVTAATDVATNTFTYASTGSGAATGTITYTTVYRYAAVSLASRNCYISGAKDNAASEVTDCIFIQGSSGFQNRSGSAMTGNFFYEGYVSMGATQGVNSPATDTTGAMNDNVLQRYAASSASNGSGSCPGWGFLVGGGLYNSEIARNIFTQAQNSGADLSGIGYGLTIAAYVGDTDEPFHRATTGLNIHDNILDVVYSSSAAPSGILEDEGANRTERAGQYSAAITGTWANGQTLTCTPSAGYSGVATYSWRYNAGAELDSTPTHVAQSSELTGANGTDRGLRCWVSGRDYTGVNGVGITGCTVSSNVVSNQTVASNSVRKSFGIPTGNTACSTTNTSYVSNRVYADIATAKSTEGWTDETRTLKSYLVALGYTVTTSDGAQEFYNAVTAMWRGKINTNVWSGKKICNHIRAGRGLAAL